MRRISPYYFLRHKVASSLLHAAPVLRPTTLASSQLDQRCVSAALATLSARAPPRPMRTYPCHPLARPQVATSHERGAGSVFIMLQHFFDTELVRRAWRVRGPERGARPASADPSAPTRARVNLSPMVNPSEAVFGRFGDGEHLLVLAVERREGGLPLAHPRLVLRHVLGLLVELRRLPLEREPHLPG